MSSKRGKKVKGAFVEYVTVLHGLVDLSPYAVLKPTLLADAVARLDAEFGHKLSGGTDAADGARVVPVTVSFVPSSSSPPRVRHCSVVARPCLPAGLRRR